MTKEYNLVPRNNQKSFYGKAKVYENGKASVLKSYDTFVCSIDRNGNFSRHWCGYSVTTQNHINSYRLNNGLDAINKKEWQSLPVVPFDSFTFFIGKPA